MLRLKLIPFLILFNTSFSARGAEVDQFTKRNEQLNDSSEIINSKANEFIDTAIASLNQSSRCNEKELYVELRKYFANHSKGKLTIFALHDESIDRRTIKIKDSIFRDWGIFDGQILGKKSANSSPLALSPLIRMGETTIGIDKFEHMFGRGFSYFKNFYLKDKSIKKTLNSGVFGEKTLYGGNKLATGVFSYADLAANFNGMRFWNHILQLREDLINDNYGPIIKCQNNKWVKVKNLDFTHYIDESMDEAINCSKFPTKKTAQKYENAVKETILKEQIAFTNKEGCPLEKNSFINLKEKYGDITRFIINQTDDRVLSYFNEF